MKTTRKRTSAKTAAGKTAAGKTDRKTARSRPTAAKAAREKVALVESLQGMGLLEQTEAERLEKKAETLGAEKSSEGLNRAAGWDRNLRTSLEGFSVSGGDKNAAHALQALMLWQGGLAGLSADPEGIGEAIGALRKVVPYSGATLFLRDPDRQTVRPVVSLGIPVDLISRIRFSEGMGFSSWVAGRRKPVLYASLHRNEAPGEDRVRSFISVPLVVGEACVGVLNLGHHEDGFYGPAHLRTLILAAAVLASLVQRHVALNQIAEREIRDPKTGLATAGYLRSRLEEEVVRCRELGHSMSLLVFRLNELEEHVERFGPEYRGRCRSELAELVSAWREPSELVGHGTDDRVVVILPSARREKAEARAAALREALEKHNFPRRKRMTVGLGLATYPADAEAAQDLYDAADKALYDTARTRPGEPAGIQPMALS